MPLKEALAKHQIWTSMEEVFHQDWTSRGGCCWIPLLRHCSASLYISRKRLRNRFRYIITSTKLYQSLFVYR
jgi:hypothetical protein